MKRFILLISMALSLQVQAQNDSVSTKPTIVLLKNEHQLLPFKNLANLSISYSNEILGSFGERYSQNRGANTVLVTSDFNGTQNADKKVLILFGDSLEIERSLLESFNAIIYAQNNHNQTLDLISQKIFGGLPFYDTLTGDLYGYKSKDGIQTEGNLRFSFGIPSEVGIDSAYLHHKIDSISLMAIDSGVAPGIQVLVARNGKVILHKTYGFLTYENKEPVKEELLYDFASLTKITGALPVLMQLYDQDKFSLDATMGTYLPYFAKGNKKDLQYRQILSHNYY